MTRGHTEAARREEHDDAEDRDSDEARECAHGALLWGIPNRSGYFTPFLKVGWLVKRYKTLVSERFEIGFVIDEVLLHLFVVGKHFGMSVTLRRVCGEHGLPLLLVRIKRVSLFVKLGFCGEVGI